MLALVLVLVLVAGTTRQPVAAAAAAAVAWRRFESDNDARGQTMSKPVHVVDSALPDNLVGKAVSREQVSLPVSSLESSSSAKKSRWHGCVSVSVSVSRIHSRHWIGMQSPISSLDLDPKSSES